MKELLVPVQNMECLISAINAGADAVYLGGKRFGARNFADNFSDEELVKAIETSHLYGVKVYVTVNTLIHESEINEVINFIKFLHKNNVDAIIVQDIGLISLVRKILPNLEIHASTQTHVTNENTFKLFEDLGVSRVVVAREMDIHSINEISTNLEIEAFIHGALCVSYSGQCLFSSRIMNRSGNRGECAQICRLPFELKENDELIETDGKYLLSTKELNTTEYFKDIMDSNIYSLKIEGRMKSAEYVGCVTKLYRDLIDKYYNKEELKINHEYLNDLRVIFNREYTKGFINNESSKNIVNINTSNHVGIPIGEVVDVSKKYISIKLNKKLNQGDGIRFMTCNEGMIINYLYDESNLLVSSSDSKIVKVLNKGNVKVGEIVNKTYDREISLKYRSLDEKKIKVDISFFAHKDEKIKLTISDKVNSITVYGNIVGSSKNAPITKDVIKEKLSKLGDTIYEVDNINIDLEDNLFIPVSHLNELRRVACKKLNDKRVYKYNYVENKYQSDFIPDYNDKINFNILVRNEEQLKYLLDKNVSIIVPSKCLYEKYKDNKNVYYRTLRVKDNYKTNNIVVTELGSLYNNKSSIGDYYLNITNHFAIDYLSKYLKCFHLSVELSDDEIHNIMKHYHKKLNSEVFIYGRLELMLLKYCPLNKLLNNDYTCSICKNGYNYYLVDRNKFEYPLIQDEFHHTHVLDNRVINKFSKINYYKDIGINNFRIELFDEDKKEIDEILNMIGEYL